MADDAAKGGRVAVLVTVKRSEERLASVAASLSDAGLQVDDVMDDMDVVAGSIAEAEIERLAALPQVEHVERERGVRIPPPDAPVQ